MKGICKQAKWKSALSLYTFSLYKNLSLEQTISNEKEKIPRTHYKRDVVVVTITLNNLLRSGDKTP